MDIYTSGTCRKYISIENKDYRPFTYDLGIFILLEPCRKYISKGLKGSSTLITLIRDKYS
jgi:hypothetical protein